MYQNRELKWPHFHRPCALELGTVPTAASMNFCPLSYEVLFSLDLSPFLEEVKCLYLRSRGVFLKGGVFPSRQVIASGMNVLVLACGRMSQDLAITQKKNFFFSLGRTFHSSHPYKCPLGWKVYTGFLMDEYPYGCMLFCFLFLSLSVIIRKIP